MKPKREVSRIEGFSDAVFGFALTLLVVSLEVPSGYRGLAETLGGFLAFAVTFAVVVWIWYEHYLIFRKFGLEDGITVVLNAILLFVVLFFVYPLKFVFSNIIPTIGAAGFQLARNGFSGMTLEEARHLLMVYSAGFVAVFGVLALLHVHAGRQWHRLNLEAVERYDASAGARRHLISVGVGILSLVLAMVLPGQWLWLSGVCYTLLGPLHGFFGYRNGRRRQALIDYHPAEEIQS